LPDRCDYGEELYRDYRRRIHKNLAPTQECEEIMRPTLRRRSDCGSFED
jgi:hypothetical protein